MKKYKEEFRPLFEAAVLTIVERKIGGTIRADLPADISRDVSECIRMGFDRGDTQAVTANVVLSALLGWFRE